MLEFTFGYTSYTLHHENRQGKTMERDALERDANPEQRA